MVKNLLKKSSSWLKTLMTGTAIVACAGSVQAASKYYDMEVNGLRFSITSETDSTCELVYNPDTWYPGDIVIPEKVNGFTVTAIGLYSFYSCDETKSIVIPNTVTTLGPNTFMGCGISELNIPASVVNIYGSTFGGNRNLKAINVDAANPVFKSQNGVLYKGNIEALMLVPSKYAGDNGVYRLPETVWALANNAFENCNELTEVYLTNNVTYMEASMFYECHNLRKVTLPAGLEVLHGATFLNCKSLTDVQIPTGVKKIGFSAFQGCESLKTINIPAAVDTLEFNTFKDCKSLESIALPAGLKLINYNAFENCTSLTTVNMPAAFEEMGESPFAGCTALTTFTVDPANTKFYTVDGVLFRTVDKCLMAYPIGRPGDHYDIPEGTECIDNYSLRGVGLKSIKFPSTLWFVNNGIVNCPNLESIDLGSVEELSRCAIYGNPKLTRIVLPATVTTLGKYALSNNPLAEIVCMGTTPPEMLAVEGWFGPEYNSFDATTFETAKLLVPEGSVEAYKAANGWNQFVNVSAGVDNISVDADTQAEWYTLGGVRLNDEPTAPGLYLRRTAKGTTKVSVR